MTDGLEPADPDARLASVLRDMEPRMRALYDLVYKERGRNGNVLSVQSSVLDAAVAGLYNTFSHRRLSHPFRYCDCCITDSMAARWQTVPLKQLDRDDLWAVMENIPATCGLSEDLLYFTPRILQHAAVEDCVLDLSWMYYTLLEYDPVPITRAERAALRRFFDPIWTSLRQTDPLHCLGITNIVLPTAALTGEIRRYLDLWAGSNAIDLYLEREVSNGALQDAFWDARSKAYHDVLDWLKQREQKIVP